MISLYPHQSTLVESVRDSLKRFRRSIMCGPPGIGKTRMTKHILAKSLEIEGRRALFCVHRRGLVENASQSFSEEPRLEHGLIMSGIETQFSESLQVASIDTLNSWWCKPDGYHGYTFDFIAFDECHSHCKKLQTFLKYHDRERKSEGKPPAFVLGLSATPQGESVADVFFDIVTGPNENWLIENGYLKPYRYFAATKGKLDQLVKRGGEFTKDSVISAMDGLAGDLVRDWNKYGKGRSTVGFFPSRIQAKQAKAELRQSGIDAEYVDGETSDDDRRFFYKMLDSGDIEYLCNVGVVERGTDIPRVGCVQLCTAIGSIVRYRQMIGRGSRPHPDVENCIVIDHGDNVRRHGLFEDPVEWTLQQKVTESATASERPSIECPSCGRIYRGGKCRECEYEPTQRERKSQGLEFNGKELQEIKKVVKPVNDTNKMMVSCLFVAGRANMTFGQMLGMAYKRARDSGLNDFRIPRFVEIGNSRFDLPRKGEPDYSRKVKKVFEWTDKQKNS